MDTSGNVLSSFAIPDTEGGAKGITWDGEYLYLMGWTTPTIYKLDKSGSLIDTIEINGGVGGGLTWDGNYFWAPGGKGISKFDTDGRIVGEIYAASEGTWDVAWDGQYLWATQRTNENWQDAKLYQIEILISTTTCYPIEWNEETYHISICSILSDHNLTFSQQDKELAFNIRGPEGIDGVCIVAIPYELLSGDFTVIFDGEPLDYALSQNGTHAFIDFEYTPGLHEVSVIGTTVIPEFQSSMIIALFMTSIVLTVIIYTRKHSAHSR